MTSFKNTFGLAFTFIFFTFCFIQNASPAPSPLDATYDSRLYAMCVTTPQWPVSPRTVERNDQPIPKTIFQIWFGKKNARWAGHLEAWQSYAERFGYTYRLYTDEDIEEILHNASSQMKSLFWQFHNMQEYRGLSDLARYLVLNDHGGIYIDADMRIPVWRNEPVDFISFMPLRGLVVVADGAPVDWGVGGLHVLNGIMASCPKHSTLEALLRQIPGNARCCVQAHEHNAVLLSGPAALTTLLTGPVTVIPITLWDEFGVPDPEWR